jgi:RNA polymerase sigma-70 factor (ECF subfamily)
MQSAVVTRWGDAPVAGATPSGPPTLRALFDQHFDFVWRSARRLGLTDAEADDAAQAVFIVAARKLEAILPDRERAFLFASTVRVVADVRKSASRRHEVSLDVDVADTDDDAGAKLDQLRAKRSLEEIIAAMPMDLRTVFVLFELEALTMAQIAELLQVPPGTVASRLRRARDHLDGAMVRLRKRFGGGA